jgi:hypothetical protein
VADESSQGVVSLSKGTELIPPRSDSQSLMNQSPKVKTRLVDDYKAGPNVKTRSVYDYKIGPNVKTRSAYDHKTGHHVLCMTVRPVIEILSWSSRFFLTFSKTSCLNNTFICYHYYYIFDH